MVSGTTHTHLSNTWPTVRPTACGSEGSAPGPPSRRTRRTRGTTGSAWAPTGARCCTQGGQGAHGISSGSTGARCCTQGATGTGKGPTHPIDKRRTDQAKKCKCTHRAALGGMHAHPIRSVGLEHAPPDELYSPPLPTHRTVTTSRKAIPSGLRAQSHDSSRNTT